MPFNRSDDNTIDRSVLTWNICRVALYNAKSMAKVALVLP